MLLGTEPHKARHCAWYLPSVIAQGCSSDGKGAEMYYTLLLVGGLCRGWGQGTGEQLAQLGNGDTTQWEVSSTWSLEHSILISVLPLHLAMKLPGSQSLSCKVTHCIQLWKKKFKVNGLRPSSPLKIMVGRWLQRWTPSHALSYIPQCQEKSPFS